jgi:RNA polymerase sigma-70 factor (ECF subfamily)
MFGHRFAEILSRARSGQPEALEALYRALHPPVLTYLRNQLPTDDAEDAASDVFVSVAHGLSRFEGTEASFRSWVFTIAHHRIIDYRRAHANQRTDSYPPAEMVVRAAAGDAERDALASVGNRSVLRRIAALPAAQAEVVLLRVVADLSVAEVASIVRKRPEAVRALTFRALKRLAREYAEEASAAS